MCSGDELDRFYRNTPDEEPQRMNYNVIILALLHESNGVKLFCFIGNLLMKIKP